jgi:hypothetical protein
MSSALETQEITYKSVLKVCEERADAIKDCPIQSVVSRLKNVETGLENVTRTMDALKIKGWELLFRIIPWILLFAVTVYTVTKM